VSQHVIFVNTISGCKGQSLAEAISFLSL